MKDIRVYLPVFLLIIIVLLLAGCKGFVPSPGTTDEDVNTISGQIKMPLTCCDTLSVSEEPSSISRDTTCDESEIWPVTPGAIVELKSAQKGQCKKVIETTIADDTGNYIFEDVKPGLYIITAYCPVEADEGFLLKDVAEKLSGEALDAGIPDCTSTAIALVIEKINNCYNDWYQCYGRLTASKIYKTVETIASDIGKVDIPAIKAHADFGNYCDDDIYGLVDMICEWSCCIGAGATTGGGGGTPTPGPCAGNVLPSFNMVEYYDGEIWTEISPGDNLTFFTGIEYKIRIEASDDGILNPLVYKLFVDDVLVEEDLYPDPGPLEFTGTPGVDDIGEVSLDMVLADGCGETTFGAFDIKVCPYEPYLIINIDDTSPCAGTCANVTSIVWKTADDVIDTFEPPYEENGSNGLGLDWTITGTLSFDPETGDICWLGNDIAATARPIDTILDTIKFTYYDECGQGASHDAIEILFRPELKSLEITHVPIEICVGETIDLCDYITNITAIFEDDSTDTEIVCADLGFPIISNNLIFTSPSLITGETIGDATVLAQYTDSCGVTKRATINITVKPNADIWLEEDYNCDQNDVIYWYADCGTAHGCELKCSSWHCGYCCKWDYVCWHKRDWVTVNVKIDDDSLTTADIVLNYDDSKLKLWEPDTDDDPDMAPVADKDGIAIMIYSDISGVLEVNNVDCSGIGERTVLSVIFMKTGGDPIGAGNPQGNDWDDSTDVTFDSLEMEFNNGDVCIGDADGCTIYGDDYVIVE